MEVRLYQGLIELNWNLLFSMITVLVLILILKHFFFEKVHSFMVNREKAVACQLENVRLKEEEASRKLTEYEQTLTDADDRGREIILQARSKAESQAEDIVNDARKQASSIIENAENQIKLDKEKAMSELKGQVAELAVLAAGQIIKRELEIKGQDELIDQIIEEAGKEVWQK